MPRTEAVSLLLSCSFCQSADKGPLDTQCCSEEDSPWERELCKPQAQTTSVLWAAERVSRGHGSELSSWSCISAVQQDQSAASVWSHIIAASRDHSSTCLLWQSEINFPAHIPTPYGGTGILYLLSLSCVPASNSSRMWASKHMNY